jgi:hypothetical protein
MLYLKMVSRHKKHYSEITQQLMMKKYVPIHFHIKGC